MVLISNPETAAKAKYDLERALFDGNPRQFFAADALIATLTRDNYELSIEWGKLIFSWWDDCHSQNWCVVAYEIDQAELRLHVRRGIGREKSILTLRDPESWREFQERGNRSPAERRKLYAELMARLITAKFKDAQIQRVTTAADRSLASPGRFARLTLRLNNQKVLAIGINEDESQADIDASVAAGLIWLARRNVTDKPEHQAKRCWFCLPRGRSITAIERLSLIDAWHLGARLECFEIDERRKELVAVRPVTQDELLNTHPRKLSWPADLAINCHWRDQILNLAPGLIEVARRPGFEGEILSINGLEFARVTMGEQPRVKFGITANRGDNDFFEHAILNESNFSRLEDLVKEVVRFRSIDSPDRRHPFYRLRPEAWLESLLRRDIRALDAGFDARFVYSQIPTWRADERSVIDLLTVNHESRLVVIEVKAAEDPQLPLQGLDYWLRVEQARLRKEFERRGMFDSVKIADQPPLLYLVAPRLRFHRSFATVARCLAPQIEAYQIGINANWREGVRVYSERRTNGSEGECETNENNETDENP